MVWYVGGGGGRGVFFSFYYRVVHYVCRAGSGDFE